MRHLLASTFVVTMVLPARADDGEKSNKAESAAIVDIETEILRAMEGGMGPEVAEFRKSIRALAPEARRKLAMTVRPGEYQWRFQGVHPADRLGLLEYIVSSKIKNYETLLVVEGKELERLQRFGRAFDTLRRRLPDTEVNVQLSWFEHGRVRTVGLWEILAFHEAAKVKEFIKRLDGNDSGIGAINLKPDLAALPQERTPAQVIITLRITKE